MFGSIHEVRYRANIYESLFDSNLIYKIDANIGKTHSHRSYTQSRERLIDPGRRLTKQLRK